MIIRQTPIDIESYILIQDTTMALKLQELEFYPKYMDEQGLYFEKSIELELALNKIKEE